MDKEILRLHEKAIVHFRFEYYPEFIEIGDKIIFREGRTKGVGEIIELF
jgi:elongation factor 1-alpha